MTQPLLQSVRAVQPSGPYLIAGYSFGGVLAYELATQLIAAGESVAWLGLLDTPFSGVLGRRPSQAQLFLLYASRGWRELVRQCRSALRRELRSLRVRVRPDPHVFDYRGAEILGARYSPEGIEARLAVIATDVMVTDQRFGPSLGWDGVHKGPVEKHVVPGNHESLLLPPNVHVVAEVLSASMSAAAAGLGELEAVSGRPD
jgi:thioesterase domain-containing protein